MSKKPFFVLYLVLFFLTSPGLAEQDITFNPRDDYVFGVGTMIGGPLGVVGLLAEFNWSSLINAGIGLGSGLHFDTYLANFRYLILDRPFTPYLGAGLAYWKSASNGPKLAAKSKAAVDLGLVREDGSDLKNGILVFPISLGVHYMSDLGLAIFADIEYMTSLSNLSGTPYGALGIHWYF